MNTDWMGLSIRLDGDLSTTSIPGYVWKVYENGTNVWERRSVLYTERADRVCTLLSRPKSKLICPDAALLEIDNEWLYHGIGVGGIVDLLCSHCPFFISGMSRCDLCLDFCPDAEQWEIIKGLADGDVYVSGKRCGSGFWSVNYQDFIPSELRGIRIPHCISWGHKTSSVKWKLYYKSKELRDEVGGKGWGKPYIVDQWRVAGFDENNVWRLEVSMHNCNALEFDGEKLTYGLWKANAIDIMTTMYNSRFVCRRNEGHRDKSNDTIVRFLPIDGIRRIRCKKYEGEVLHNGRITLLRHLVHSLEDFQILLDDESREDVLWHIGQIIERDGLNLYFKSMVGMFYEDYIEWVRCQAIGDDSYNGCYEMKMDNKDVRENGGFPFDGKVVLRHSEYDYDYIQSYPKFIGNDDVQM